MKRIINDEITQDLSEELLIKLATMANEVPVSKEWIEYSKMLSDHQKFQVYKKRGELIERKEQERIKLLTNDEKLKENKRWNEIKEDLDPHKFYGNMGSPVSIQDFKNRYGVWPPGYDDKIDANNLPDILSDEEIERIAKIYIEYKAPQYWAEICSALLFKKTNQLKRVFDKVFEIKGKNFPLNGNPLRQLTIYEFKKEYGIWPPGYEDNDEYE